MPSSLTAFSYTAGNGPGIPGRNFDHTARRAGRGIIRLRKAVAVYRSPVLTSSSPPGLSALVSRSSTSSTCRTRSSSSAQ